MAVRWGDHLLGGERYTAARWGCYLLGERYVAVRWGCYLLGERYTAARWCCYLLGGGKVCGCEMVLLPAGRGKGMWL